MPHARQGPRSCRRCATVAFAGGARKVRRDRDRESAQTGVLRRACRAFAAVFHPPPPPPPPQHTDFQGLFRSLWALAALPRKGSQPASRRSPRGGFPQGRAMRRWLVSALASLALAPAAWTSAEHRALIVGVGEHQDASMTLSGIGLDDADGRCGELMVQRQRIAAGACVKRHHYEIVFRHRGTRPTKRSRPTARGGPCDHMTNRGEFK